MATKNEQEQIRFERFKCVILIIVPLCLALVIGSWMLYGFSYILYDGYNETVCVVKSHYVEDNTVCQGNDGNYYSYTGIAGFYFHVDHGRYSIDFGVPEKVSCASSFNLTLEIARARFPLGYSKMCFWSPANPDYTDFYFTWNSLSPYLTTFFYLALAISGGTGAIFVVMGVVHCMYYRRQVKYHTTSTVYIIDTLDYSTNAARVNNDQVNNDRVNEETRRLVSND